MKDGYFKYGVVGNKKSDRIVFSKKAKMIIHEKTKGKCAYCGCDLELKKMQIDHIVPIEVLGTNDLENLLPSCRMCNFYKSTSHIDRFRNKVETIVERLEKLFIFRLAIKYGIVEIKNQKIQFEFERIEKPSNESHPEQRNATM